MMRIIGFAVVLLGVAGIIYLVGRLLAARGAQARLRDAEFPRHWGDILRRQVPLYSLLPDAAREGVDRHVLRFLAEKNFEACGELEEVTEEIQLTVAGNACLLLAGRPGADLYPALRSVLIYPGTFVRPGEKEGEQESSLLGESWDSGSVVLSWDTVKEDVDAGADGFNVVLHEFAHQLDQDFGLADGLPLLDDREQYQEWAEAFTAAYERHRSRTEAGFRGSVDPYGAQDPAEFFSCATETFFEQPEDLSRDLPQVYEQLSAYYRLDPREWISS